MKLFEIGIPPGVVRIGTELKASGRWWDTNLVRWVEGVLQPWSGWFMLTGGTPTGPLAVTGKARATHAWRGSGNVPLMAIGSHSGLFLYTGAELFDISPVGLAPGRPDTVSYTGYGIGIYGRGLYGTPRPVAGAIDLATTWSLDNFGEFLLAVHSDDGRLMEWRGDPAIKAVPVVATTGTVPTDNKLVLVTEERFAMLFGARGDPRRIEWPEKEDYTQWAISATTSAGFMNIQTAGIIKAATKVRKQNLVLTNLDAHTVDYVGYPAYYGLSRVGMGCGVIGSKAVRVADDIAYWMGDGSFFRYDGSVTLLPCAVRDYVFSDINVQQVEKVHAVRVAGMSEVMWYYPSQNSNENDRYVAYNYLLDAWHIGILARTAGEPKAVFPYPIYIAPNGQLYAHEQGRDYEGAIPYAESGPVEMGDASRVFDIVRIIPDERTQGQVQARFRTRYYPNGPVTDRGPYTMANPTSVRFSGREISVRVESAGPYDWRIGRFRFDYVLRGSR